jgi:hypothetical protein
VARSVAVGCAARPPVLRHPPSAPQSDNAGVLVLSEFAGAAQSLGAGAILVNPWNIADVAQARARACTHACLRPAAVRNVVRSAELAFPHPTAPQHHPPWHAILPPPQAIEDALTMSEEERRERHRQNYMHVATHTAQVGGARARARAGCQWRCGRRGPRGVESRVCSPSCDPSYRLPPRPGRTPSYQNSMTPTSRPPLPPCSLPPHPPPNRRGRTPSYLS